MSNPSDRDQYTNQVRRETYQDPLGNTHTEVSETVSQSHARNPVSQAEAYRNGYVSGKVREREIQETNQTVRDNDNAARGLLLGILLTSLLGLIVGLFFLNRRSEPPVPATPPVIIPERPSPSPSPQSQNKQTTIIERIREVPIPQPASPSPEQRINITVPPAPAPSPAPSPSNQSSNPSPSSSFTNPNSNSTNSTSPSSNTNNSGNTTTVPTTP